MKKILLTIIALLLALSLGYSEDQPLRLTIKLDKQVYAIDENITLWLRIKNSSSGFIPFQELIRACKIIFDGKEYSLYPESGNCPPDGPEPIGIDPNTEITFTLRPLSCYGINQDILTLSKHNIAVNINEILSNTITIEVGNPQQTASNQSIKAEFIADVIGIIPIEKPLPPKDKLKGYVIDNTPNWELSLEVLPHERKIPFQPGLRTCYIANPEEVFGTSVDKIKGRYKFSYIWNTSPGNPEFENFKATLISDPIERLVERLSKDSMWINGVSPVIRLPKNATPEQVLSEVFKMSGFDQGYVTDYKILKIKEVKIPDSLPDRYTAVLAWTNFGEKIVLLKYEGEAHGTWWSRVYDSEPNPTK